MLCAWGSPFKGFFMHKSYKYRIFPSKNQAELIDKTIGCARFAWNQCVETFNSYDKEKNPKPKYSTSKELRQEYDWMNEVSAAAIQQKQNDFKEFKNQHFNKKRKSKVGRPKFKSKHRSKQTYRLPNQKFKLENGKIRLEKIGWVKHDNHRDLPENVKLLSVTISKSRSGRYYVSINFEFADPKPKNSKKFAGIDVGFKQIAVVNDGKDTWVYDNPNINLENQEVKKLQRHLARKKKGSNRWIKCKLKLAKAYEKLRNKRDHCLHEISRDIVDNFGNLCLETLNIESMKTNIKNVNRKICGTALSRFMWFLEYKCLELGNKIIKIDKYFPSTQTCHNCGNIQDVPLDKRVYECNNCGMSCCRDENSSINIRREGIKTVGVNTA